MKHKPSYEELEQKILLLKKDRFNIKKTSAVITPEPLRPIFAAAQETVDRYLKKESNLPSSSPPLFPIGFGVTLPGCARY